MKLDLKLAIAFITALVFIVVVGISSFVGIQQTSESNRMVAHTHEVLANLEHILSLIKDAETGQRGFVLTGDERYLEPYNAASREIEKAIASLGSLANDNPANQKSIRQLEQLSRSKFEELQSTIILRKEGRPAAALAIIRTDRGKRTMDEIRMVIAHMNSREWQLLDKRNRIAADAALHSIWAVGIGMIAALLIISAGAVVMTRSLRFGERSTHTGVTWGKNIIRYVSSLVAIALAILLRQWLTDTYGAMPLFVTFYPAVLLVAIIGGGGPGIMATLLSVLAADYWFIPPYGSFAIDTPNDAISLAIFGSSSLFLSVFSERLHRARLAEAVSVIQEKELAILDMGNLLTLGMDRRIIHWSQGCSRMYGFNAQESQGHQVDELLQTRISQPWEEIQRTLLEHGYWEGEITRCSKSGTELSLTILLALRRDAQGSPLAILEVSTDLTTQKSVENALVAHKLLLQSANEELLKVNETLQDQAEELQAQSEELQTQSEELQAQAEELQAQAEELHAQNDELAILWDESRRAKEALAENQERLMLALSSSGMATFEWDIINDRRYWDDNVHRLLMTNPLIFTGTAEEFYRVIHPDDRDTVQSALSRAINTKESYNAEYRVVWPDYTVHHIAARGKIHRDSDERAVRMTGVCWDITEQKLAENVLHNTVQRFYHLLSNMYSGILLMTDEGRVEFINQAFCDAYDLKEAPIDLVGLTSDDMFDKILPAFPNPAEAATRIREILQLGQPVKLEEFAMKDGRTALRDFIPLNIDGKSRGRLWIYTDITEHSRAEEALRESDQRFRLATEATGVGIWEWNVITNQIRWDNQMFSIYGITPTDDGFVQYSDWSGAVLPEDLPEQEEILHKTARRGGHSSRIFRICRRKDSECRNIQAVETVRTNAQGEIEWVIGTNLDVTERYKAEETLRRSKEEWERTFDSVPELIAILDNQHRILRVNNALARRLGHSTEDCIGLHCYDVVHGTSVPPEFCPNSRTIIDGIEHSEEVHVDRFGGDFQVTTTPFLDEKGEQIGSIHIAHDVTERKRMENDLKKLNDELEMRVSERTKELEANFEKLKNEISEREKAEINVLRLNRLYTVLSETNQAIVRADNRDALFYDFCRIAVEHGGFLLSWVGLVDEINGQVYLVAASGATEYLTNNKITANEEFEGVGPTGISIREGTYYICNDFQNDPCTRPWHEKGRSIGICASASVALKEKDRVIGALTLYTKEKNFFDNQHIELLVQLGADVSYALDNLALEAKRQAVERALSEETNERLRAIESLREKEQLLLHQSRQAAMGEMIGNIAHQWRQPLNFLGLKVQQLLLFYDMGGFSRDFLEKSVSSSMEYIQYMSRTIDDFRNYFKPEKEKSNFAVSEAIAHTLALIEDSFKHQNICIAVNVTNDPVINGYRNEFAQVVLNILNNARDVLTERETEDPKVTITICSEGEKAVVSITDNAGGIPEEIREKIFEPYFTTKGPQLGTGVGLFMSKTIIEKNMGGNLTASNIADGAEFRIEV